MDDGVLHVEGTFKVRAREWAKGSRGDVAYVSRPIARVSGAFCGYTLPDPRFEHPTLNRRVTSTVLQRRQ